MLPTLKMASQSMSAEDIMDEDTYYSVFADSHFLAYLFDPEYIDKEMQRSGARATAAEMSPQTLENWNVCVCMLQGPVLVQAQCEAN